MLNHVSIACIRFYRRMLSPLWGPRCRFYPTCSEYSLNCFEELPFFKALYCSAYRIFKCHPFHSGGYDPLPLKKEKEIY